ncbi:MAG: TIGR04551 family protein [Kofleriaceae bacterium]|nr:TIGR04551 family protein [Kofleriaceae bacterium]
MTRALRARRPARWPFLLLFVPGIAAAQVTPGLPTGAGGPGPDADKKDGVAEQAPKTPGLLPTTPTLPPPKGKHKRFELIELDGYFRLRSDWMKNFNLGFIDDPDLGGAPFPEPLGCSAPTSGSAGDTADRPCGDSIKSTNMRLRLEPTINLDETTSVHMQVDVLDNVVLGSTPTTGQGLGLAAFEDTQGVPQAGINSAEDAIRVKRAWAEVATPLGIVKFGRQPDAWGMGMFHNSGSADPINGGYDLDSERGDTVDRVMFGTLIPGTQLRGAIAMDFPMTGRTSAQTGGTPRGQGWDLDDNDDVRQWSFVLSHLDTPDDFRDAVERGELTMNYGVYLQYRKQAWDYTGAGVSDTPDPDAFVPRDATAYIPDLWLKLGYKQLQLELEGVAIVGSINKATDVGIDQALDLRQFGGVGRVTYRAVQDKLKVGLEVGGASGDQWDNDPQGSTHISTANTLGGARDGTLSWFRFDPEYKIDLILFRELIGAVTNAAYAKPFLSYQLTKGITARIANVTSFALKPVATPGNGSLYGVEFDGDLGYTATNGFSAGIAYGVLFPLSAMNHPEDPSTGSGFGYGAGNTGDAGNAHTIQFRLGLSF